MLYFAYGSNLHPARIDARVETPIFVGIAVARDRQLAFHKVGQDGSAKCDAPKASGYVYGALYELDEPSVGRLDRYERVGAGYERSQLVVDGQIGRVEAVTYLAQAATSTVAFGPFTGTGHSARRGVAPRPSGGVRTHHRLRAVSDQS